MDEFTKKVALCWRIGLSLYRKDVTPGLYQIVLVENGREKCGNAFYNEAQAELKMQELYRTLYERNFKPLTKEHEQQQHK